MPRWMLQIAIVLTIGGLGWAQSRDRAGTPIWPQYVRSLGDALVDASDHEAVSLVLPAGTSIRRFDRLDPEDRLSLREWTAGAVVVAALGYDSIPTTMASDLSRCLRDAEFITPGIRDEFILDDPQSLKQADDIAAQWVSTSLQPGVEQPVGVVVLWQQHAPEDASQQPTGQLIFILVKAHQTISGQFRISQLIYGDTRQILR